jgi:hypothetical protein
MSAPMSTLPADPVLAVEVAGTAVTAALAELWAVGLDRAPESLLSQLLRQVAHTQALIAAELANRGRASRRPTTANTESASIEETSNASATEH